MSAPMKYAERTALGQHLQDEDHDLLVNMYRGFTPSGIFLEPYTYLIVKTTDGGVDYYGAYNGYQCIYGGYSAGVHHNGGVDGESLSTVLTAAYAAGKHVLLAPGTFTLDAGFTKPADADFIGCGVASILVASATAEWMLTVPTNINHWERMGQIGNMRITGNSTALGGIKIIDNAWTNIFNLYMSDFTTGEGIRLAAESDWVEQTIIKNVEIRHCLKGVRFKNDTGGTTSLAYNTLEQVRIATDDLANAVGVEVDADAVLAGSDLIGVIVWLDLVTNKGFVFNGDLFDASLNLTVENQSGVGAVGTALEIGANGYLSGLRQFHLYTRGPSFDVATKISNLSGDPLYVRIDAEQYGLYPIGVQVDDAGAINVKTAAGTDKFNVNTVSGLVGLANSADFALYSDDWVTATFTVAGATGAVNTAGAYQVDGTQVVTNQQGAIANVAEVGTDEDGTARAKINVILTALRNHGLIDT